MEKKQTAVDYLVQELIKQGFFKRLPVIAIQQAAQIEKEQIQDAFVIRPYTNFEKYYNETYGGNNE
jgi:hypothetical protein